MPEYSRTFAQFVFDGSDDFFIPKPMGEPNDEQLQGNARENTLELCGRVCYDSLGAGRATKDYHDNLISSKHLSVYEHTPVTVEIDLADADIKLDDFVCLANRPGVTVLFPQSGIARITINYRAIMEWVQNSSNSHLESLEIRRAVTLAFAETAPMVFEIASKHYDLLSGEKFGEAQGYARVVEPENDREEHITIFMRGSRGFSHEQVRHRFSISQRSTRYVDEASSPWVKHPLILQYLRDIGPEKAEGLHGLMDDAADKAQEIYTVLVDELETWLTDKGHKKTPARKQARGAARGFLGNALQTEMMFTASVKAWRDIMLVQRASKFADAEIREVYAGAQDNTSHVIAALKQSRFADRFSDVKVVASPDGIGNVME